MKCENTVKIGDVVKSLDFPHTSDCYYIGLVTEILNDGRFRAKTIKRVWRGKEDEDKRLDEDWFLAPLPGRMLFDDEFTTPRIQVLA